MDEQGFVELENTLALLRRALSALTALKPMGIDGAGGSSVEAGESTSFQPLETHHEIVQPGINVMFMITDLLNTMLRNYKSNGLR